MENDDQEAAKLFEDLITGKVASGKNRSWPFKTMAEGQFIKINNYKEYAKACNAVRQVTFRKGIKFCYIWHEDKGYGIIGRAYD